MEIFIQNNGETDTLQEKLNFDYMLSYVFISTNVDEKILGWP